MIHFVIMAQDKIKMHDSASHTTEKDENTELLKEKLLKVNSVLAAHQIALWEININTLECTFTQEYFESLGLDKVGIRYQNLEEFCSFVHPDDKHLVSLEGFQKKLDGFDESNVLRVRCVGAHGEIVWLEDHLLSVEKDKSGNPERLLCYTVNVTGQCEREAHISRVEERNRKIIQALPEFIFILDQDFFITDVLMSSDTILLHPVEQLRGADGRTIYSPEVSDLFLRNIRQCLEDGELKEIEYPLDVDDCERHYFQARIAPFEDNKVMALIHDIGDRVQRSNELIEAKQRAEEADRMKSVFLANMSHEIRTPLNAIVGFSSLLAEADDDERESYMSLVEENNELLLNLISDILDISKIEAGTVELIITRVDVARLCREVISTCSHKKHEEAVGLRFDESSPQIMVDADKNRIMQVLSNFITNALKFTTKGSVTLSYRLEDDGLLHFCVTDTGKGIPAEQQHEIFSRFVKLDSFSQGAGLGLSICQSLVERMGGQIGVNSREGEGSCFWFTHPYTLDASLDSDVVTKGGEQVIKIVSRNYKPLILVAEDIDSNYLLIEALLRKDYRLLRAHDGNEAIDLFNTQAPDLIFMDMKMPGMNGIDTVVMLREGGAQVPIIALTAFAYDDDRALALNVGCNDFLTKPVSPLELRRMVSKWIGK